MTDFLDRLGDHLQVAELAPAGATTPRRTRRRKSVWAIGLAAFAIATPAVAVMRPWEPELGRPAVDGPVTSSNAPVPKVAEDSLAVLRRPQTAADRANATPLLRVLTPQFSGVQTDGVRSVADGWALVPVNAVQSADGSVRDYLCLVDQSGTSCGAVSELNQQGVSSMRVGDKIGTQIAGVVPDGITTVRFTPADGGAPLEAKVNASNFFALSIPSAKTLPPADAPPEITQKTGAKTVPGGFEPAHGTLEWLDADGRVQGPEERQQ